jgi:hypothetical protein
MLLAGCCVALGCGDDSTDATGAGGSSSSATSTTTSAQTTGTGGGGGASTSQGGTGGTTSSTSSAGGGASASVVEACEALNEVNGAVAVELNCLVQVGNCMRPAQCAAEVIAMLDCFAANHTAESCTCIDGGQGGGPASGDLECDNSACSNQVDAVASCNN